MREMTVGVLLVCALFMLPVESTAVENGTLAIDRLPDWLFELRLHWRLTHTRWLFQRSDNLWRAAVHLERQGEWEQALRRYKSWPLPPHECGVAAASQEMHRRLRVHVCRLRLADPVEAARLCLRAFTGEGDDYLARYNGPFLARLYRDAGQLEDLSRIIADIERTILKNWRRSEHLKDETDQELLKSMLTWETREAIRIAELAQKRDVAALLETCRTSRPYLSSLTPLDLEAEPGQVAAEALAECGNEATGALRKAILEDRDRECHCLIYALGKGRDPAALTVLKELTDIKELLEEDVNQRRYSHADTIAYAIARKGEAGAALLKELADHRDETMRSAARRWYWRQRDGLPQAHAWKLPKPGSLPKSILD